MLLKLKRLNYSKTCLTWTLAYADTQPTLDKILWTDRFLSIYPLKCGRVIPEWWIKDVPENKITFYYVDT